MKSKLTAGLLVFLFTSCTRNMDMQPFEQSSPSLKKTVTTDTSGRVVRVVYYNDKELPVQDTSYASNGTMIYTINQYNSRGKRTRMEYSAPIIYNAGYLWAYNDSYVNDTLLNLSFRFYKGSEVARTKHFYNAAGHLVLDSMYNYSATVWTRTRELSYDVQGRLRTDISFSSSRDTIQAISYAYSGNRMESIKMDYNEQLSAKTYQKLVTDYNNTGAVVSEKQYAALTQMVSQTDYTYDANGYLTKKTFTQPPYITEERYTNNSFGKPDKMETFVNDKKTFIQTYYYQ